LASDSGCNVESVGQETVKCRPLDSAIEKGKGKEKKSKRKARKKPLCMSAGRAATQIETKNDKDFTLFL